eukprot:2202534-Rhodomonas_salina.2
MCATCSCCFATSRSSRTPRATSTTSSSETCVAAEPRIVVRREIKHKKSPLQDNHDSSFVPGMQFRGFDFAVQYMYHDVPRSTADFKSPRELTRSAASTCTLPSHGPP